MFCSPCSLFSSSFGRFCFIPNLSFFIPGWFPLSSLFSLSNVVYWYLGALFNSAHLPVMSLKHLPFSLCTKAFTVLVNTQLFMGLLWSLKVRWHQPFLNSETKYTRVFKYTRTSGKKDEMMHRALRNWHLLNWITKLVFSMFSLAI